MSEVADVPDAPTGPSWRSFSIAVLNFLIGAVVIGIAGAVEPFPVAVLLLLAGLASYAFGLYRLVGWFE